MMFEGDVALKFTQYLTVCNCLQVYYGMHGYSLSCRQSWVQVCDYLLPYSQKFSPSPIGESFTP